MSHLDELGDLGPLDEDILHWEPVGQVGQVQEVKLGNATYTAVGSTLARFSGLPYIMASIG